MNIETSEIPPLTRKQSFSITEIKPDFQNFGNLIKSINVDDDEINPLQEIKNKIIETEPLTSEEICMVYNNTLTNWSIIQYIWHQSFFVKVIKYMINHKNKLIFIHLEKEGGSFIEMIFTKKRLVVGKK